MTHEPFPLESVPLSPEAVAGAEEHRVARAPHVQSMLALHRGRLVWERYYGGHEVDFVWPRAGSGGTVVLSDPYPVSHEASAVHNIKSATKSVMATLVGIALGRGDLTSVDAAACDFLPQYFSEVDPDKREITLRHLLQMRSGLHWEENGPPTMEWLHADDPVGYTVRELPLVATPGERWRYSTADSHLLGACLAAAVRQPIHDYAAAHLLAPMGIVDHRWSADPQGRAIGGSELFLTGRDMLRLGQLWLQRGRWGDDQLVSAEWVEDCVRPQPDVTHSSILRESTPEGMTWPEGVRFYPEGYGYQFWRTTICGHPAFLAEGLGGQVILVVDALDLVVAMTATTELGPPEEAPATMAAEFELVENFLVPAL